MKQINSLVNKLKKAISELESETEKIGIKTKLFTIENKKLINGENYNKQNTLNQFSNDVNTENLNQNVIEINNKITKNEDDDCSLLSGDDFAYLDLDNKNNSKDDKINLHVYNTNNLDINSDSLIEKSKFSKEKENKFKHN